MPSYDENDADVVVVGVLTKGETTCDECGGRIPKNTEIFFVGTDEGWETRCRSCYIDSD